MPRRLAEWKRREVRRLVFEGHRVNEAAAAVGCRKSLVYKLLNLYPWAPRNRNEDRLSLAEREEISRGLRSDESMRSIARRLKRAPSTISREVAAQGGKSRYRAHVGEERADRLAARPRPGKLSSANPELTRAVEERLARDWSPEQVAGDLRDKYPDNRSMHVSHETIYKALYIQGRGTLRKELVKHLRTGRTKRSPRTSRPELRGKIANMVMISERPAEVSDRAVPGHWEGDLIMGKGNKSAIGTLVERQTRFVMLLHLANGKTAEYVRQALTEKIQTLPEQLRRSITWDQGSELSQHAKFTVDTGVQVYFCNPHSPWERGSNENTNGLLRQYFPKGEDLSSYSATYLDEIARKLNERPRQTLKWKTPLEKLTELLR